MEQLIKDLRNAIELQIAIQGDSLAPLGPSQILPTTSNEAEQQPMSNLDLFGNTAEPKPSNPDTPYESILSLIPESSPLNTFNTLDEVEEYVRSTVIIPLDETRLNPVFGVGNPTSDLMVIGERPLANK